MPLPDRELAFYSWPRYEEDWIEEGRSLEFRCEFQSIDQATRRPVLARLLARLAVSWDQGIPGLRRFYRPGFVLDRVEDLDFAVALDGKRVFDAFQAVPEPDEYSLLVPDGSGGRARIVNIVYNMKSSLMHMTKIRSGQTPAWPPHQ
ncbi:hypothetical protein ABZT28_34240 [Streptomyces sp. NPDC005388]|uniref:hypothetical protein n=1 Tax=Streptomyces sp. NPDC005388 TaxID=3156717 RepID=UPI0033ADD834